MLPLLQPHTVINNRPSKRLIQICFGFTLLFVLRLKFGTVIVCAPFMELLFPPKKQLNHRNGTLFSQFSFTLPAVGLSFFFSFVRFGQKCPNLMLDPNVLRRSLFCVSFLPYAESDLCICTISIQKWWLENQRLHKGTILQCTRLT